MARRFTHYDIVISCPSDMTEERATVQKAVDDVKKHGRFVTGWVEGTLREQFKEIR